MWLLWQLLSTFPCPIATRLGVNIVEKLPKIDKMFITIAKDMYNYG
jgi:hypothetical protein